MIFENLLNKSSEYNLRLYEARKTKNFKEIEKVLFEFKEVREYIKVLFKNYNNKSLEYCKLFRNGLRIDDSSRKIYEFLKLEELNKFLDEDDLNQIIDYILLKVLKRYIPFQNSHISFIIRNSILRSGKYFYALLLKCSPKVKSSKAFYISNLCLEDTFYISSLEDYHCYLQENWNINLLDTPEFTKMFRISYSQYKKIRHYANSTLK